MRAANVTLAAPEAPGSREAAALPTTCRRLRRLPRRSIGGPSWAPHPIGCLSHGGIIPSGWAALNTARYMRYGGEMICRVSVPPYTSLYTFNKRRS